MNGQQPARTDPGAGDGSDLDLSVVVPVYDDPVGVRETLDSLVDQDHPSDRYEVLVVDNGSTDHTRDVVRSVAAEHPQVALLVERDVQSSYAARNRGLAAARAPVLAFVDADMTAPPSYVASVVETAARPGWDHFGCAVDVYGAGTPAGLFNVATGFDIDGCVSGPRFVPTCALVARRSVFDAVGGFDDRLTSGGDFEWGSRATAAGYPPRYAGHVVLRHPARTTVRGVLKKHRRVGRGYTDLRRRYPDRTRVSGLGDVRNLLPPHPGRFAARVRAAAPPGTPRRRLVAAYGVGYLAKLAEYYGRLEAARERHPTDAEPTVDGRQDATVAGSAPPR